jgi:flagellar basal body rod protein FlgG
MDALDRLAADIANASTPGYKGQRATNEESDRPSFGDALQSVIDVASGPTRVDLKPGSVVQTSRDLDVAIEGNGFFAIDTAAGPRYTRNGHFARRADGVLTTADGDVVQGTKGEIKLGNGPIQVDESGNVRTGGTVAGTLRVVEFDNPKTLIQENAFRFRTDATANVVDKPSIKGGALEQSNVSIIDRVAELASTSRNFESLQKAMNVLMNDIDGQAIAQLGRR